MSLTLLTTVAIDEVDAVLYGNKEASVQHLFANAWIEGQGSARAYSETVLQILLGRKEDILLDVLRGVEGYDCPRQSSTILFCSSVASVEDLSRRIRDACHHRSWQP